jgi:hypothetical protein
VQKLGRRKLAVIGPQILSAVGLIPDPKSRISATSNASKLTTASVILPFGDIHVELSEQIDFVGHEKRASMQRTALGRGEQAYTSPAPVALLIQVWELAQDIPFPQFCGLGAIIGRAETPILEAKKNIANVKSRWGLIYIILYYKKPLFATNQNDIVILIKS